VIGQDQFNSADPPQTFDDITLTPDFPLLSTISMMAPSPDWFSGIFDVNPAVDGVWLEEFSISTYPFDAGTEMGTTYSITNPASTPRSVIYPLVASTVPQNGILLDPTGTKVLPVAMWSCTLKTLSEPTATTPAPAPEPSESPAAQPECFEYSQTCTVNADCCSQRCRSGVCRLSTALTTYRDGFRISIQDGGTNIGGAAGRDRSNGSGGGLLRGRV
jgi:Spondin_N